MQTILKVDSNKTSNMCPTTQHRRYINMDRLDPWYRRRSKSRSKIACKDSSLGVLRSHETNDVTSVFPCRGCNSYSLGPYCSETAVKPIRTSILHRRHRQRSHPSLFFDVQQNAEMMGSRLGLGIVLERVLPVSVPLTG